MKLYKVLDADKKSPFQGFQFGVGEWYRCEDFDESEEQCSRGYYATGVEGLTYAYRPGRKVFECQVKGKSKIFDIYKQRYEYIRLIRELSLDEIKTLAKAEEEKCGYKLCEALFPFNPFTDANPRNRVTQKDIENLKKWITIGDSVYESVRHSVYDSVRDSVGNSVYNSVRDSVRDSVRASVDDSVGKSVWDSVRASVDESVDDSVWDSVWDSVYAYIGSLFLDIKEWEYVDHRDGEYPFQCLVDLWHRGFVPSFDGKVWRLHKGKKAKIVYEEEKR